MTIRGSKADGEPDPWANTPFIPYVYRGTGVDQLKGIDVYGDVAYNM